MSEGHDRAHLRRYRHPEMKRTYEEQPDGTVLVTTDDGRRGRFHVDGRYIEGDLTQAAKHMLYITGGTPLPDLFRYRWGETPLDLGRPSGWPEQIEARLAELYARKPPGRR